MNQGAILPWFSLGRWTQRSLGVPYQKWSLENLARTLNFSLDAPFRNLTKAQQDIILFGTPDLPDYEGIIPRMGTRLS